MPKSDLISTSGLTYTTSRSLRSLYGRAFRGVNLRAGEVPLLTVADAGGLRRTGTLLLTLGIFVDSFDRTDAAEGGRQRTKPVLPRPGIFVDPFDRTDEAEEGGRQRTGPVLLSRFLAFGETALTDDADRLLAADRLLQEPAVLGREGYYLGDGACTEQDRFDLPDS